MKKSAILLAVVFFLAIFSSFAVAQLRWSVGGKADDPNDTGYTLDKLRNLIIHNGFTATIYNQSTRKFETFYGSFRNNFERRGEVVVDHATGRMWQRSTFGPYTYEEARSYINQLNQQNYAGYSDWYLPMISELASLTQANGFNTSFLASGIKLHLDPNYFDGRGYYCMSSDIASDPSLKGTAVYVITWAGPGSLGLLYTNQRYPVKAVRTID
ncbi:MAG: DUF1566 domain-containing protein [Desulfobacterales bacterium]